MASGSLLKLLQNENHSHLRAILAKLGQARKCFVAVSRQLVKSQIEIIRI
jgi:hypothetical protein